MSFQFVTSHFLLVHHRPRNSSIHVSKGFAITSATTVIVIGRVIESKTIGITPVTKVYRTIVVVKLPS